MPSISNEKPGVSNERPDISNEKPNRNGSRDFEKSGHSMLAIVGLHGWPTKKILGFRWSKKAKITLENVTSWRNTSIIIFKFFPFLYTMKTCR